MYDKLPFDIDNVNNLYAFVIKIQIITLIFIYEFIRKNTKK